MDQKRCTICGQEQNLDQFYIQGHSEKDGHPYYSSACKPCLRLHRRDFRERDRHNLAAWQTRNRDHYNAYMRNYNQEHREQIRADARGRYHLNQGAALRREHYRLQANTPEGLARKRRMRQVRRAHVNQVACTLTPEAWQAILQDFEYRCAYCGKPGVLTQDHFVPISQGGPTAVGNIVPACRSCNCAKHNRDPREFLPAPTYAIVVAYLVRSSSRATNP